MHMNETGHPTRAHTNLLPQTQPLPSPPSGGLQSLGAEPPYARGWPDATIAGPEKNRKRNLPQQVRLGYETAKE